MASITSVVAQIKNDPSRFLLHLPIRQVCTELGLNWRERCLDPATTPGAPGFIKQIIHGNRSCAQMRHLGDRQFSGQAYCQARQSRRGACRFIWLADCSSSPLASPPDSR